MLTDIKNDNGTAVAVLKGEIDHHNAKSLRTELDHYIVTVQPERFAIDFGGITFMDSSGIAVIIKVSRRMRTLGGRAWIEDPARQPQRVIDASGIDRLVPVAMSR